MDSVLVHSPACLRRCVCKHAASHLMKSAITWMDGAASMYITFDNTPKMTNRPANMGIVKHDI